MIANQVTMVETVPAMARLPVEKMAPIRGVIKVTPQVGQPAPRAMRPVIMPAFSRLAVFCFFFLFQSSTIRPMRMPCKMEIAKIGSQSRKGVLIPKIAKKHSPMMRRPSGKPRILISSNFDNPPDSRFISIPKNIKLGINPYQNRLSLVASNIPFPASAKSSSHFLQFICTIIPH